MPLACYNRSRLKLSKQLKPYQPARVVWRTGGLEKCSKVAGQRKHTRSVTVRAPAALCTVLTKSHTAPHLLCWQPKGGTCGGVQAVHGKLGQGAGPKPNVIVPRPPCWLPKQAPVVASRQSMANWDSGSAASGMLGGPLNQYCRLTRPRSIRPAWPRLATLHQGYPQVLLLCTAKGKWQVMAARYRALDCSTEPTYCLLCYMPCHAAALQHPPRSPPVLHPSGVSL